MKNCFAKILVAAAIAGWAGPAGAQPAPFMMRATVSGHTVEGQPLAWDQSHMLLLGRDGALYDFKPADAKDAKKTAARYAGYTSGEMKALVRDEFGRQYDVSATAHYVVVHAAGAGADWGARLEELYRSFTHYMGVRGFPLTAPATPLTAVVFRNRDEYYAYTAARGVALQPGTLGHYDPVTNRMFLFDSGSDAQQADWASSAETIIHEATHQAAYNVGVHTRFAEQPRWAVEGLAMMFEARGVWDAASIRTQTDRLNRYRLDAFRQGADRRGAGWLTKLVGSDGPFETDALAAYAQAWTLTFYLCETRPQEYSGYLARIAARPLFSKYPPQERAADFEAAFGGDLELLSAQLGRYVATLP